LPRVDLICTSYVSLVHHIFEGIIHKLKLVSSSKSINMSAILSVHIS
jgi:hypothetical protein